MVGNVAVLQESVKKLILEESLIGDGDLLIVAVSGGADSLSLLHVLHDLGKGDCPSFSLFVAHLNHGLRGKSAREDAEFVRQEAQKMGLPSKIATKDCSAYARRYKLSLEDAARRLRYGFLQQLAQRIGAARIAVGHTREDQVETLLLNILRGTGLAGLTGMKTERKIGTEGLRLIRPLLKTSRKALERYCLEKGLSPRWDETNLETRFLRNRIRLELIPLLEKEYNPNLLQNIGNMAELLLDDHDFLHGVAKRRFTRLLLEEEDERLVLDGGALLKEHGALQGRILRLAVKRLIGTTPREIGYSQVGAILNLIQKGPPHGRLHLPFGLEVSRSYARLKIYLRKKNLPRVSGPFKLAVPGEKFLPGKDVILQAELLPLQEVSWFPAGLPIGRGEAYLDYDKVLELLQGKAQSVPANTTSEILVRTRRAGDYFHPLGAPGKKKLSKYFIDQKIPREEREQIPLVLAGGKIIWVAGKQLDHGCRMTEKTERVLALRLIRR